MNEMSVREWQERFRAGDFSSRDRAVQCEVGWYDWFCRDDALAGTPEENHPALCWESRILHSWTTTMCGSRTTARWMGRSMTTSGFEPLTGERDGKILCRFFGQPP